MSAETAKAMSNAVQGLTQALGLVSEAYAHLLLEAETQALSLHDQVVKMGKALRESEKAYQGAQIRADAAQSLLAEAKKNAEVEKQKRGLVEQDNLASESALKSAFAEIDRLQVDLKTARDCVAGTGKRKLGAFDYVALRNAQGNDLDALAQKLGFKRHSWVSFGESCFDTDEKLRSRIFECFELPVEETTEA